MNENMSPRVRHHPPTFLAPQLSRVNTARHSHPPNTEYVIKPHPALQPIAINTHAKQVRLFPRIAVKSQPGRPSTIVRETETVLDEKVTLRTEEVPCPITGIPHLRTVEVVEKVIETEVG